MLSVHGGIVGGDCSVFEEVELMSVGRCSKYSCVAPVNVVSMSWLCLAGADFMLPIESV